MRTKIKRTQLVFLTESAIMTALAFVLGLMPIWRMPMGGEVTLLSMLPIILISLKYGVKKSLPVAFLNSLIQLFMGISGGVFTYCITPVAVTVCVLFDYIVPYSVLALSGMFSKNRKGAVVIFGIVLALFLRFMCHYITGVVIWKQWAENMSPYLYSLIYNGQYMLPECIFTCAGAAVILKVPQIRRLIFTNVGNG